MTCKSLNLLNNTPIEIKTNCYKIGACRIPINLSQVNWLADKIATSFGIVDTSTSYAS